MLVVAVVHAAVVAAAVVVVDDDRRVSAAATVVAAVADDGTLETATTWKYLPVIDVAGDAEHLADVDFDPHFHLVAVAFDPENPVDCSTLSKE